MPSPIGIHQVLGVDIVLALRQHCPRGYTPVPDLSLAVDARNEPRPDVVVIRTDLLRRSPASIEGVLLAVEIVSPDSHFRDMHAKVKLYAAAGVASYWVVDPTFEQGIVLTQFRLGEDGDYEMRISTDKVFVTEEPYPVVLDLPALTAVRDELPEQSQD